MIESDPRAMRVVFVVRSLHAGGTVRQLVSLALGLRRRGHSIAVLRLFDGNDVGARLADADVETTSAALRGRADLAGIARAAGWLQAARPEIVYGFNVQENLLALLTRMVRLGRSRVVWGIRTDDPGSLACDAIGRLGVRAARIFARRADLAISNSRVGAASAARLGVPVDRIRVIPNGIATEVFRPDPVGRRRLRAEWGVGDGAPAIGTVARLEQLKGHRRFLDAARVFADADPSARFVCVGDGDGAYRRDLERHVRELRLENVVIWTGTRTDMPAIYSALDLTTLLSASEGSPNVVAEALACGVPCVATDVGDTAAILGEPELLIADEAPDALAAAWRRTLDASTPALARERRARIERDLSLPKMVLATEEALATLVRESAAGPMEL